MLDAAWEATPNRVAALTAYAGQPVGSDERRRSAFAQLRDPAGDAAGGFEF